MTRSGWTARTARDLLAARDARSLLEAWLAAVDPPASLVALLPGEAGECLLFRRDGNRFRPLAAPPLPASAPPGGRELARLPGERRDALDDLLWSLGAGRRVSLPVGDPARARLVLADTGLADEPPAIRDDDLEWLVAGLETLDRPVATARGREIPALVSLARALGRAVDAAAAARAAAVVLDDLVGAVAGAVVLRDREGEVLAALAWPPGSAGEEALARAGGRPGEISAGTAWRGAGDGGRRPVSWLASRDEGVARIALGFPGPAPGPARRLLSSVEASLALAVDRIVAERARATSRLGAAFEGLPVGVVLLSREGRVRLVNREGRALLERLGAWPGEGNPLPALGSLRVGDLRPGAGGGQGSAVDLVEPREGRIVAVRRVPLRDGDGEALLVLEDVTVARRQQAQLARAEKMSALGVLIGGIVHEINNPLSTIRGYAQMLGASPDADRREEWIRLVLDEAARCQRIVGDLLAFARTREPSRRPVSPGAIAEKAVGLLGYQARRAGVELVVAGAADCPPIEADADGLLQVLVNLLTNAIHALEEHEGTRRVEIRLGPAGDDGVELVVADTGPGIPPETLDRVFDPFFTTKPEGKGTGLGLSVVAGIVRDHGGTISVDSPAGRGAVFTVRLPRRATVRAREGEPAGPAAGALAGRRVLVAEDEPTVGALLREVLETHGAVVDVAGDGEEALRRVRENRPDAVLCDVSLPRRSGLDLHAALRRDAPHLAARVVLTTGDLSLVERLARDPGAPPVLAKPFDLGRLVATVRRVATENPGPGDRPAPGKEARP